MPLFIPYSRKIKTYLVELLKYEDTNQSAQGTFLQNEQEVLLLNFVT